MLAPAAADEHRIEGGGGRLFRQAVCRVEAVRGAVRRHRLNTHLAVGARAVCGRAVGGRAIGTRRHEWGHWAEAAAAAKWEHLDAAAEDLASSTVHAEHDERALARRPLDGAEHRRHRWQELDLSPLSRQHAIEQQARDGGLDR